MIVRERRRDAKNKNQKSRFKMEDHWRKCGKRTERKKIKKNKGWSHKRNCHTT